MTIALTLPADLAWAQPLAPVSSVALSALVAACPLAVVLVLVGVRRWSGRFSSACGLVVALLLAVGVWGMPVGLAGWTLVYGCAFTLWSILWTVFNGLWLYNLSVATGSFGHLRRWVQQCAPDDRAVQAILVAFCFGALLEGSAENHRRRAGAGAERIGSGGARAVLWHRPRAGAAAIT